ncbi:hypothetical protein [Candidatus Solincola tengchongensis]|nr:hypothetical protein [Candidatus Solincola tengchongensis]
MDEVTKRRFRRQHRKLDQARFTREINSAQSKLFKTVSVGAVDHNEEA